MSFVIRRKADGYYAKGKPITDWTEDLQRARVFVTKTTAKNSIPRLSHRYQRQKLTADDLEVVEVLIVEKPGEPRCVNAHDRCYEGGPCPYCEPSRGS